MLEPYEGKLSRTVLRGEGGGNASDPLGARNMKAIETGNSRAGFQEHLLLFLVALVILVVVFGVIRGILFFGAGVALLVLFNLVVIRSLMWVVGKWDSRRSRKPEAQPAAGATGGPAAQP